MNGSKNTLKRIGYPDLSSSIDSSSYLYIADKPTKTPKLNVIQLGLITFEI